MQRGYGYQRDAKWSLWSERSLLSIASSGSVLSIGSVGSVLSFGSIGSALSLFSVGSALSVSSALSSRSRGSLLSYRSTDAVQGTTLARPRPTVLLVAVAGLAAVTTELRRRGSAAAPRSASMGMQGRR